jgi:phosphatidate cytidylyltransferase
LKKLITRSVTGIVLVLVILIAILTGPYTYALLFISILIGGIVEFSNLFKESNVKPNKVLSLIISVAIYAIAFLVAQGTLQLKYILSFFPMLLIIMASELFRKKENPVQNISITIFSIIYLAIPLSLVNFLVFPEILGGNNYTPKLLIALFTLIWIYDSGAYLVGVSIGKHRLFERISPKKSWEGAIGGTLTAILAAHFIAEIIPEIKLIHWIVISLLIVISSTFGDLTESMFKRFFVIKDSGNIFPGHGGVLDRFDSLLFAATVVVTYLKLFVE